MAEPVIMSAVVRALTGRRLTPLCAGIPSIPFHIVDVFTDDPLSIPHVLTHKHLSSVEINRPPLPTNGLFHLPHVLHLYGMGRLVTSVSMTSSERRARAGHVVCTCSYSL